jgi:hypothetical protein
MKIILALSVMVAAASAYGLGSSYVSRHDHNIPTGYHHVDEYHGKDYYHHPSYKFEYGVNDPHTHDHKSQWEVRDGDVVKGEYTLDEADGTKRVVKYSSDKHNGFQAHVERIGHAHHEHKTYGHY